MCLTQEGKVNILVIVLKKEINKFQTNKTKFTFCLKRFDIA